MDVRFHNHCHLTVKKKLVFCFGNGGGGGVKLAAKLLFLNKKGPAKNYFNFNNNNKINILKFHESSKFFKILDVRFNSYCNLFFVEINVLLGQ